MLLRLRDRLGAAGLVVAVIALVAALGGASIAATGGSDGGKATASANGAAASTKGKRGPRGPQGPQGPAGPQGPKGDPGAAGAKGKDGANGQDGTNGQDGINGQTVTTELEAPFGNCGAQAGVKVTSASGVNYLCDGAPGAPGPPGGFTEVLPPEATETGLWNYQGFKKTVPTTPATAVTDQGQGAFASISFNIPLAAPLDESHVHYVPAGGPGGANCPGTVNRPEAAPGHLCVYESVSVLGFEVMLAPDLQTPGAGTSGAILAFSPPNGDIEDFGIGSWAVTGSESE
jgi:hypothetical protein